MLGRACKLRMNEPTFLVKSCNGNVTLLLLMFVKLCYIVRKIGHLRLLAGVTLLIYAGRTGIGNDEFRGGV
jgi:hypothetical protein